MFESTRITNSQLPIFIVCCVSLIFLSLPAAKSEDTSRLNAFSDLRIGVPSAVMDKSKLLFSYTEAGHFGDKTQYDSVKTDECGAIYSVHCKTGQAYGIEVKYPAAGVARDKALKTAQALISRVAGKQTEHDDDDLRLMDCNQPCEFFYYEGDVRVELLFVKGSNKNVVQIGIWKK